MSTASLQSASPIAQVLSRRREHVEDPALVQLVVADEVAVAVPDASRREVRLALTDRDAVLALGIRIDPEVERAAHDDAELLVAIVLVEERARGTAADPPEAELERLAVDDS